MNDYEQERRERGQRVFAEVNGFEIPVVPGNSPLAELTVDHVFGEIWTRPGLTRKERRWIALTSVAAASADQALKIHVAGALGSGDITIDEMREFVAHFAVYQGFPKAVALSAAIEEAWAASQARAGDGS